MSGLLWPGGHRAGGTFDDAAVLMSMVDVEATWLSVLVEAGVAPPDAAHDLVGLVDATDLPGITVDAAATGTPVMPLLRLLRDRLPDGSAAVDWLHRGLTSQDVVDTALTLCCRDVCAVLRNSIDAQVRSLDDLLTRHRRTAMVARTLTQHAVPTTFGAKAAVWLHGILDAADDLDLIARNLPAQFGGAAGTRAAAAYLADGAPNTLTDLAAARLGLRATQPWHTVRTPTLRVAAALGALTAAYAHVANDVLVLNRPEIGELGEPREAGHGGSSAMPHKANPVLSVSIRRAGLAAPALVAQVYLAAAEAVDERPDGAWQLEWQPLQTLARTAVEAAGEIDVLLAGMRVDHETMAANLAAAWGDVRSERDALGESVPDASGSRAAAYDDAPTAMVDAASARAQAWLRAAGDVR